MNLSSQDPVLDSNEPSNFDDTAATSESDVVKMRRKCHQFFGSKLSSVSTITKKDHSTTKVYFNGSLFPVAKVNSEAMDTIKSREEVDLLLKRSLDISFPIDPPRKQEILINSYKKKIQELDEDSDAIKVTTENIAHTTNKNTSSARTWKLEMEEKKNKPVSKLDNAEPCEIIRISNLTEEISQNELYKIFGPRNNIGKIKKIYIAKDNDGNRRGFAFITYADTLTAMKAVETLNKKSFKHTILQVDYGHKLNKF